MVPIATLVNCLSTGTKDHSGAFHQEHEKLIFRTFFLINFNSTALFKNAFLGLDLAGRPFGGDFEQLSPRKMKKAWSQ